MSARASSHRFPAVPLPKALFGYEVIDFIGEGAGSLIYAVSHPDSRQLYALKHVIRKTGKDLRFIEQLETEFAVGRQLTHPALRRAIDLQIRRTLFRRPTEAALVLELFDGRPLEFVLPRTIPGMIDCFIRTAWALESLHKLGWVHCDLKPNNILLNPQGDVKVIDFGQACRPGTVKSRIQGTPDYIAPEQVKCKPVTVRTDAFNFGATCYWALCGRKLPTLYTLRKSDNSFLVDDRIPTPRMVHSSVPESLSNLVMECVRTSPAKRPGDMGQLARRLEIIQHAIQRSSQPHTGAVVA